MKFILFLSIIFTVGITSGVKAQSRPYPLSGIGIDAGMKVLGRWGDPASLPDGKVEEKDGVKVDVSPKLSKKEIKEYGKSPIPQSKLYYEGEVKNNTFHGLGTLRFWNDNTGFSNWEYTGEFVNGKAEGFGELKCVYSYRFLGNDNECWFRGEFKDGLPTIGTMYLNFHREKKNTPTVFYTGQVKLYQGILKWHGYGILFRSEMDHSDPRFTSQLGVPGAFYAGQFFNGSETGFGITNIVDSTDRPGTLISVLTGADDIFARFDNLQLNVDFLTGLPYASPSVKSNALSRLFPKLDDVEYKELPLTNEIKYKGMTLNNLPYGLGYIEYPGKLGKYRDIAFWKDGKKMLTEEALKTLLPDSNWLNPKNISVYASQCSSQWNFKTYKYDEQCENKVCRSVYYGSVSAQGHPNGWGWMYDGEGKTAKFKTTIGKYKGVDISIARLPGEYAEYLFTYNYSQQFQKNYYDPTQAEKDKFYSSFEAGVFDAAYSSTTNFIRSRTSFAEDRFVKQRHVDYVRFEKLLKQQLSSRPTFTLGTFYRKKSRMEASYVVDSYGNKREGIYIPKQEIRRGDHVFLGSAFYYVHDSYRNIGAGITPSDGFWHEAQIPAKVFVIRDYNITQLEHRLEYCSGCSNLPALPTGPVTITGSAHSGRYETNVYQNNSGGGSIVSKPIYNQISITLPPPTRKPCKVCNDRRKNEKVPIQIVEL